ncbi:twin-arginine translocation signal domain-containing protein [Ectothiorhodospiraceae bacterium BW-2]|nr:twin-arginine translocation signal domain-containing protein [Ectothiorhodospiraceae bacterium BW-2]
MKQTANAARPTLTERMQQQGISRRGFLKFCTAITSALALSPAFAPRVAHALGSTRRPSVIWMSFQECTGCTESILRSHFPSIEGLIFDQISLDYHHTLQAAAGHQAEAAREEAMAQFDGEYLLLVDGSIPYGDEGVYSTIAGISNLQMLQETVRGAAAVISIGTCAAYGGLPQAKPNPTGAMGVEELMNLGAIERKPLVNVPGCPPIPLVMTGIIVHYLTFGTLPELDRLNRPKAFYGDTVHDRCYRRTFYDQGKFAETFDDKGARLGWCLYKLGCKGPTTYNACATLKWNDGTSFPIESGHGCIGCSEPGFWDAGSFYKALSVPIANESMAGVALAVGAVAGAATAYHSHQQRQQARTDHETVSIHELEK